MCCDEGKLLAYLDGELSAEETAEVAARLSTCGDCASAAAALEADRAVAPDAMERLQALAEVVPLAASRPQPGLLERIGVGRIAAAAAVVLVAGSFAFAPVRSAAAGLLKVFRVQKVQTVSISQQDLKDMSAVLEKGKGGHVDLKNYGELWVEESKAKGGEVTLAKAQAAVDFPILLPKGLEGTPKIALQPGQTLKFKLKVDAINEALRYYGSERTFPASIDGKVFTVKIPTIVTAEYAVAGAKKSPSAGPDQTNAVFLGQARSPELVVPDGVDPAELRDVLMNLPFLPQNVRDQLAAVGDWQSTLIIPDVGGTARDITLDGVPAVVMSPEGPARNARNKVAEPLPQVSTVIWNKDGVVRALGGAVNEETAIRLAKSTMR
jgi:hypothetical protein